MIDFMRSLLGWSGSTRTVVGHRVGVDIREVAYIQASNARINALFSLYKRFRGTPYEQQVKTVYEKTKTIHTYLVARKKIHELEIFHIQHTEHFINTFTVILDAQQRQPEPAPTATAPAPAAGRQAPMPTAGWVPGAAPAAGRPPQAPPNTMPLNPAPARPMNGRAYDTPSPAHRAQAPRLTLPEIRIDAAARIRYELETGSDGLMVKEIGLQATAADKEDFLAHLAARFGISHISYMGNAPVNIPDNTGSHPTGLLPVILWQGTPYAIHLAHNRLFPVTLFPL
jgi:hypothetical protein